MVINDLKKTLCLLMVSLLLVCLYPNKIISGQDLSITYEGHSDEASVNSTPSTITDNPVSSKEPTLSSEKKSTFQVVRNSSNHQKKVAISFDDGPYNYYTEEYIKILKAYNVNATFFLVGNRVKEYPHLTKKIIHEGFEVAGHSYSHSNITKKPPEEIQLDLQNTLSQIIEVTGQGFTLFRPPYGYYNDDVLKIMSENGITTVTWSVDPRDWSGIESNELVKRVVENTNDGDIILLHEGKNNTLQGLPIILEKLQEKGFEIVSVSELLMKQDTP